MVNSASCSYHPFGKLLRWTYMRRYLQCGRRLLSQLQSEKEDNALTILGLKYAKDHMTNVTQHLLRRLGRNLHLQKHHPLCLVKDRIVKYMYSRYTNRSGNPSFAVCDSLCPVVTLQQNFDSLLIPFDHPSRRPNDTYYVNSEYTLRTHTSAHQKELIRSGLDNFLVIGDVYRRDNIDYCHYPVFHQVEGVRLCTEFELFRSQKDSVSLHLFDKGIRSAERQECHSLESVKLMEHDMKNCITGLAEHLFGKGIEHRWTNTYFPFTHPSWELEVYHNGTWLELVGCGIMEQEILNTAGADHKVGWAFGIGLERIAMKVHSIPDIRLFWSTDTGFLSQFQVDDPDQPITYQPISIYPQCINDMSFWIPEKFSSSDFYDIVRTVGRDIVEQVSLIDVFTHAKTQQTSHCYRLIYRHMERTLTQKEVNEFHDRIGQMAAEKLGVKLR